MRMHITVSAGIPPDYSRKLLTAGWRPLLSVLCGHNGRKPSSHSLPITPFVHVHSRVK